MFAYLRKSMKNNSEFLRIGDVRQLIPVTEQTIRKWVRDGFFPQPVRFNPRVVAWRIADVKSFVESKAQNPNGCNR